MIFLSVRIIRTDIYEFLCNSKFVALYLIETYLSNGVQCSPFTTRTKVKTTLSEFSARPLSEINA